MRPRKISIMAGSPALALSKAASELTTTSDNVALTDLGYGDYKAEVKSADAETDFKVSDDAMSVAIAAFAPPVGAGRPISLETLKDQLLQAGIKADPLPEAVAEINERWRKGHSMAGICVARGTPPEDGIDSRFESAVESSPSVGALRQDGRVDYYERGIVCCVSKGALLGRIVPPELGQPGRDVYGKVLPARNGRPAAIKAGRNVQVSDDGLDLRAKADGMVVVGKDILWVADTFEVHGDVDFSSGNIHMDRGSVKVTGTVRSGFTVVAGGNLLVGDAIESAFVEAGGDVRVRRGILMHEGGRLKAGGSVFAHFAQNAKIEAGGDVVIDNDISNCDITARGKVLATQGKGRIQGGRVYCGGRIEANEIGSAMGVLTMIMLSPDLALPAALVEEQLILEAEVRQIDAEWGPGDPPDLPAEAAAGDQKRLAAFLAQRSAARTRLKAIAAILEQHRALLQKSSPHRIKVRGTIYPGVTIILGGRRLDVDQAMNCVQLFYDPEEDIIQCVPL